ncbi:hypothetical protein JKF63_07473 [Porcisia hertigi]|uniref:ornithine decarboxylase n=1 Tax=Porcisia hertigi TaxID=2761500 RepID=A0A836LIZ4_9TRYP|nr:hypothetical protein JKF63_07473 [Porcisia hertigi]
MSDAHDITLCQVSHYNHANYHRAVPLPTTIDYAKSDTVSHEHTSAMTMMPPVSAFDTVAAQERLLICKARLLEQYQVRPQSTDFGPPNRACPAAPHNEAAQLSAVDEPHHITPIQSALSPTECNKWTPAYVQEVAGGAVADSTADQHAPVAANQDLVDLFFLEGSQAVNGLSFSPYPIYGPRTAEERRAAVCEVFRKYGVDTHVPVSGSALAAVQRHYRPHHSAAGLSTNKKAMETREQYWRRLSKLYIQKGVKCCAAAAMAPTPTKGAPLAAHGYEPEDPFFMIDLGRVVEQMARWRHELPMVRPYFAVKCNPNLAILEVLAALGAGFDCASKEEIHMVLNNQLVKSADDIIFANPCKQLGDMRAAQACGVTYVTVDNVLEMEKIARTMPSARAIIRIKTNDKNAQCAFSTKFGVALEEVVTILQAARRFNVDLYGVSFHVGSGNSDTSAYVSAIHDAAYVFEQAAEYGFNCTLLDIGGGYPGTALDEGDDGISFETIARAIRPVLDELFGSRDITIISEPGRYFTASTHALVMNVFAARKLRMPDVEKERLQAFQSIVMTEKPEEYQYYVNDGLYNSFNCIIFDHSHPRLLLLDDGDGADRVEDGIDAAERGGEEGEKEGEEEEEVKKTCETLVSGAPPNESLHMSTWDRRRNLARRPLRITTIFGPTCDSMDCILKKQPFPEMKLGDWLLVPDMGSYTTASGSGFNGFLTRRCEWVSSTVF